VRAFSTGRDFACVKMAAFQLYLQSGKQRKAKWMGHDDHVFGKNSLVKSKCETVRCREDTAGFSVAKVRGEVLSTVAPLSLLHYYYYYY
jgi:hypothetical protein